MSNNILNTLKSIKEEGFDPKKDKIGGGDRLEPGEYPVELTKAEVQVTQSGRTQVMITLRVVSGDSKDRVENVFISFDPDLPEFVLETNGKYLMKIAEFTGVKLTNKALQSEENLAEALSQGVGNQFLMDLTVRPNKKNPDYPHRNYDFKELSYDPLDSNVETDGNIDDDDLPF